MPKSERIATLDVLRGFALLGILFGNLTWFTGFAVLTEEQRDALGTRALDRAASLAIHAAVDAKFYSLFALLFGASLALQERRAHDAGVAFAPLHLRRSLALLAIGLAHAVFLWFGDIVSLYAVESLAFLPLRRCSARALLRIAVALLALPIAWSGLWLFLPAGDPGHGPAALLPAFASGTYGEVLHANGAFLAERWFLALYSGRFFKLLGLFLLGYLAGRRRLLEDADRHAAMWRRALRAGLLLGVPANLSLALLLEGVPERPPSLLATLRTALDVLGSLSLAIAYAAAIVLLSRATAWRRRCAPLANAGRLSLSCYVLQSAIGAALFYGYGAGWWGTLGAIWIPLSAASIFALELAFASLWLRCCRSGPLEFLWRMLAYGGSGAPVRARAPS